jgi:hypothetical protein
VQALHDLHAAVLRIADGLSLPSEQGGNRTEKPYSESKLRKGCSVPFGMKAILQRAFSAERETINRTRKTLSL